MVGERDINGARGEKKEPLVTQEGRDFGEKMEAFKRDLKRTVGCSYKSTYTEMHPFIRDVTCYMCISHTGMKLSGCL